MLYSFDIDLVSGNLGFIYQEIPDDTAMKKIKPDENGFYKKPNPQYCYLIGNHEYGNEYFIFHGEFNIKVDLTHLKNIKNIEDKIKFLDEKIGDKLDIIRTKDVKTPIYNYYIYRGDINKLCNYLAYGEIE